MSGDVQTLIELMITTTVSFLSDVVYNLWGLLLSLALLGAVGGWIYRKGFGRG